MKKFILIVLIVATIGIISNACSDGVSPEEQVASYIKYVEWEDLTGAKVTNPQEPNFNTSDPNTTFAMVDFDGGYIQFQFNADNKVTSCELCTYEPEPGGKCYEVNVDDLHY